VTTSRISVGMDGLSSMPHALYRFYDATDVLLYVGITVDLPKRMKQHRGSKPWWALVDHMQVEHFDSRTEVAAAEKAAICSEHPLFNDTHNTFVPAAAVAPGGVLYAACGDCREPIATGVLHVRYAEIAPVEKAWRDFNERESGSLDVAGLVRLPGPATWHVQCNSCAACDGCYDIEISDVLTWPGLMEWTVHLSEKSWLEHTSWFNLMRAVAQGKSDKISDKPFPARDPWAPREAA